MQLGQGVVVLAGGVAGSVGRGGFSGMVVWGLGGMGGRLRGRIKRVRGEEGNGIGRDSRLDGFAVGIVGWGAEGLREVGLQGGDGGLELVDLVGDRDGGGGFRGAGGGEEGLGAVRAG